VRGSERGEREEGRSKFNLKPDRKKRSAINHPVKAKIEKRVERKKKK
jgi:hypothetical protein